MNLADATKLAMKVLSKSLDVKISPDKVEMATLVRRDGHTVVSELSTDELTQLVKEHEAREAEAEKAAVAAAAAAATSAQSE